MQPLEISRLPSHRVKDLNRGGKDVFDQAATTGVRLASTASRPELVMISAPEFTRQLDLIRLGRLAAEVLEDLSPMFQGQRPTSPHLAWLSVFDADELRAFAADFSLAMRLAIDLGNAEPVSQVIHRWRSTAEYALAGAPLSGDIEWSDIIPLQRPEFDETEA